MCYMSAAFTILPTKCGHVLLSLSWSNICIYMMLCLVLKPNTHCCNYFHMGLVQLVHHSKDILTAKKISFINSSNMYSTINIYTTKKGKGRMNGVLFSANLGIQIWRSTHVIPIQFSLKCNQVKFYIFLKAVLTHFVKNITPSLMLNTWWCGPAAQYNRTVDWKKQKRNTKTMLSWNLIIENYHKFPILLISFF